MKFNVTPFGLFLSFFGGLLIVTLVLFAQYMIRSGQVLGSRMVLGYRPGAYQITAPNQVEVDSSFRVEFVADSASQPANAVGLYVQFDPSKLRIISVDTSQSFCQFYPENKFDNQKGTISIGCGAPKPGFTGKNTIASVTFFAHNIGNTEFTIDPKKSQILLNNGRGTNIYKRLVSKPLLILNRP